MILRKIIIEENVFLYKVSEKIIFELGINVLSVKVFLSGFKQTPLIVEFSTWDDAIIGSPLKNGIPLLNSVSGEIERVNINRPKYIKECILYGLKRGWNGMNKQEPLDGIKMLEDLNYNVSIILPN